MRSKKKLQITQLDQKLGKFKAPAKINTPQKGWIYTIRTSLNMTRAQLASKLKATTGAVQKIEEREATGQITINKLKKVGQALDLDLIYGFVPKDGSLDRLLTRKAQEVALKIVLRTNQNMKLEDQGIGDKKMKKTINELADEIKREMKKLLWD